MLATTLTALLALSLVSNAQFYGIQRPPVPKVPIGAPCLQNHTRLQVGTYELSGDCVTSAYCNANGTCAARACRRDDYPFGYPQEGPFPPKCTHGQFCSDEGDACQDRLPVGSPCQLNRDDQCAPPPNAQELDAYPRNVDGAVCLNFVCMWANVTEGQACVVENTPYIAYTNESEYAFVVSRGNCVKGMYCDAPSKSCMKSKTLGASCSADKECETGNCNESNTCIIPPEAPDSYPSWAYAAVGSAVGGTFLLLFATLFTLHYRHREDEMDKRIEYWRQQSLLRNELMLFKEGNTSTMSLPYLDSPKSSLFKDSMSIASGESQLPMLPKEGGMTSSGAAKSPLATECSPKPSTKTFFKRMNVF